MSINEASEFWDEHDFSESSDHMPVADLRFPLKNRVISKWK